MVFVLCNELIGVNSEKREKDTQGEEREGKEK